MEQAHGVFLWAIITIRDIHAGLLSMVDINKLVQSLRTLPSEIESLFMFMLDRIEPEFFKQDTAYFFQITIYQDSDYRDYMDLCRLYFCHSQREIEDCPAHYNDIAMSELVKACRILEKQLLSHTAGLLELTPKDKGQRIYGNKIVDPILFMRINFLHRTARDFLLRNDKAKSFLATYGCSEAQIRLSIARGTLAQIAHLSQGDPKCVDDGSENPVYYPFLASLKQISKAEQILGEAQVNLMKSLNYESLAQGYRVPENPMWPPSREAFIDLLVSCIVVFSSSNPCSFQLGRARCLFVSNPICPNIIAITLSTPINSLLNLSLIKYLVL